MTLDISNNQLTD